MTTADDYIGRVLDSMPPATPNRTQIALELRGHIAERVAHGHSMGEVLGQLGDPVRLSESYLSAVPLVSAPFWGRAVAKIFDMLTLIVPVAALAFLAWRFGPPEAFPIVLFIGLVGWSFLFWIYSAIAESRYGQTLGKRLFGLRVVRESGARISIGQGIVRQLPMFLQVFAIDALFALFTDKHQRAFELLSKTRVVKDVGTGVGPT